MATSVLFEKGDNLSEANLGEHAHISGPLGGGYVNDGLNLQADFANLNLTVTAGEAFCDNGTIARTAKITTDQSGLALSDNADNHVYLKVDEASEDTVAIEVNTTGSAPADPHAKLGIVDTTNDETEEYRGRSDTARDMDVRHKALLPRYDATADAPQEEGSVIRVPASGTDSAGVYAYDDGAGGYVLLDESGGATAGNLSDLTIDVAKNWGDYAINGLGPLEGKQSATPTAPGTGYNKLYFKSDGNLYKLAADGTETQVGGGGSAPFTVPDNTLALDFADDAGAGETLFDFAVTSTPTAGTEQSIVGNIDATGIYKAYAEADGAGAVQNPRFEVLNGNLRVPTGAALEDGAGTRRMIGASSGTYIYDDAGRKVFGGLNAARTRLSAYGDQEFQLYDEAGGYIAAQYAASATAPGEFKLPNATLVPGEAVSVQGTAGRTGEAVHLFYDSTKPEGQIISYDYPNGTYRPIRFAGSSFRLDNGTNDFMLFDKNSSQVNDDSGVYAFIADSGTYNRLAARSGQPLQVWDQEAGIKGLEYKTAPSAPGLFDLTNATVTFGNDASRGFESKSESVADTNRFKVTHRLADNISGVLVVVDGDNNECGVFALQTTGPVEQINTNSHFTTTAGNGGTVNVYYDTGAFYAENQTGASITIKTNLMGGGQ